jgi:hypothetical protein
MRASSWWGTIRSFRGRLTVPPFAISNTLPASATCNIGWPIASSTGAQVGAVHLQAPPYYENVRALVSRSVAEQSTAFLPWGGDKTVIPLVGAEDVARVAATLLANPVLPAQSVFALVGETPTVKEVIDALGRAVGRPIRYVPITDEQWANAVKERLNPHALDHLSHLWQYFRTVEDRYQPTDAIRTVIG